MSDFILAVQRNVRAHWSFSAAEWLRIAGLYGFIAVLHVLGWGLYLHYARSYPALVGLGFAAYMFGLRHAFDADHIAAVDDSVRLMLQKGKQPLGVGFFFSLGHSTVVLGLTVGIAFAATAMKQELPQEQLLRQRGLINRLCGGRLQQLMSHSWQMYPLGLLFGLGFDTASAVGLLAMTAGASPRTGTPARACHTGNGAGSAPIRCRVLRACCTTDPAISYSMSSVSSLSV